MPICATSIAQIGCVPCVAHPMGRMQSLDLGRSDQEDPNTISHSDGACAMSKTRHRRCDACAVCENPNAKAFTLQNDTDTETDLWGSLDDTLQKKYNIVIYIPNFRRHPLTKYPIYHTQPQFIIVVPKEPITHNTIIITNHHIFRLIKLKRRLTPSKSVFNPVCPLC